jgi:hypothetical protein
VAVPLKMTRATTSEYRWFFLKLISPNFADYFADFKLPVCVDAATEVQNLKTLSFSMVTFFEQFCLTALLN